MHPDLIRLLIQNMSKEFVRERLKHEIPFVEGQTPSGRYAIRTRLHPQTKLYETAVYDRATVNTLNFSPHPPCFFTKAVTISEAVTNHYILLREYGRMDEENSQLHKTILNLQRAIQEKERLLQ